MLELLIKALLAYLLGSVSGSMVIGTLRHVDIRDSGSGNAGGTNAFRTQGFQFALGVVIIDIGKGFVAAWLVPMLEISLPGQAISLHVQALVCGFAAVVGHCYPVWYGFRGGKGAATAVGAIIFIEPLVILPMLGAWLLVLVLTGWVGLGTMLAAISLVPAFIYLGSPASTVWFAVLLALLIVFMHRSNIRKMLNGSEYRFKRIWIGSWLGKK
jgi:glycerol-3-phosphate acyltransferase PlsY